jgi:outer membrane lipoprotein-sorting protein
MLIRRTLSLLGGAFALTALSLASARADEKGEKILREAFKKLGESKAMTALLSCKIEVEGLPDPIAFKGTVAAMKPNLLRVELKGEVSPPGGGEKRMLEFVYAADGKNYYSFSNANNTYTKAKLDPKPTEFLGQWEGEIDAFFGGEDNVKKVKATYAGSEKVGTVQCEVVKADQEIKDQDGETVKRTITYYIGKNDSLIHQAKFGAGPQNQTNNMTNIKLDAKKEKEDFTYTPPKDAKEMTPPPPPANRAERAPSRQNVRARIARK